MLFKVKIIGKIHCGAQIDFQPTAMQGYYVCGTVDEGNTQKKLKFSAPRF